MFWPLHRPSVPIIFKTMELCLSFYAYVLCFLSSYEVVSGRHFPMKGQHEIEQYKIKRGRGVMTRNRRQGSSGLINLNQKNRDNIVSTHNDYRANVSPSASNMMTMRWDADAASTAAVHAVACDMNHDSTEARTPEVWKNISYGQCGQNLYSGIVQPVNWNDVIKSWYDEVKDFQYGTGSTGGVTGHYTQLVWADSYAVGCAAATCSKNNPISGSGDSWVLVTCNYCPLGNMNDATKPDVSVAQPYKQGSPASDCEYGTNTREFDGRLCNDAVSSLPEPEPYTKPGLDETQLPDDAVSSLPEPEPFTKPELDETQMPDIEYVTICQWVHVPDHVLQYHNNYVIKLPVIDHFLCRRECENASDEYGFECLSYEISPTSNYECILSNDTRETAVRFLYNLTDIMEQANGTEYYEKQCDEREKPRVGSVNITTECPSGWETIDNSCLSIVNVSFTFDQCVKKCQDLGGNLAKLNSEVLENKMNGMMHTNKVNQLWIGLTNPSSDALEWIDGSPAEYKSKDVTLTRIGDEMKELCIKQVADYYDQNGWVSMNCARKLCCACQGYRTRTASS